MGDLNYVFDDSSANNHVCIEQLTGMTEIIADPTRVTQTSTSRVEVILTTDG